GSPCPRHSRAAGARRGARPARNGARHPASSPGLRPAMLRKNQIKAKMAAGKPDYGVMVQFPDPDLVEMLGYAGFDWILIDAEHGSINENDCANMVRACELADTTTIVRPPSNDPHVILRFLDRGAQGV